MENLSEIRDYPINIPICFNIFSSIIPLSRLSFFNYRPVRDISRHIFHGWMIDICPPPPKKIIKT